MRGQASEAKLVVQRFYNGQDEATKAQFEQHMSEVIGAGNKDLKQS